MSTTITTTSAVDNTHNTLKSIRVQDKDQKKAELMFEALVSDEKLCLDLFEKYISKDFCSKALAKDTKVEVDDMELFKKIKKGLSEEEYEKLKTMLDPKKLKNILTKDNLLKERNAEKITGVVKSYYVDIMIGKKAWDVKSKSNPKSFPLKDIKTADFQHGGKPSWADVPFSPKERPVKKKYVPKQQTSGSGRSSPNGHRSNEKTIPCFRDLLGVCKLGKECTYLHVDEMEDKGAWYEKIQANNNLWFNIFQDYNDSGWCHGLGKLFKHRDAGKYIFKLTYQDDPEEDLYLEIAYANTGESIDLNDKKQFDNFYKSLTQYMQHRVSYE